MNSFVVSNCTYDGTSGDPNPLCLVTGTVNGKNLYALTFFRYLMAAEAVDQMEAALTAVMLNFYAGVYYYQATLPWPNLIPYPSFPGSNAVATRRALSGRAGPRAASANWIMECLAITIDYVAVQTNLSRVVFGFGVQLPEPHDGLNALAE
jgi:hypothetical protein